MKSKSQVIAGAILLALLVGGSQAVALIRGLSNTQGGSSTTGPMGTVVLTGSLEGKYYVGATIVSKFYAANGIGQPIQAHLILSLTGVRATDATITIAGNTPVVISCSDANRTCEFVGTSWPIKVAETSECDIGVTMNAMVSFSWEVRAEWTTG